jgi:hypothetical protein
MVAFYLMLFVKITSQIFNITVWKNWYISLMTILSI